LLIASTSEKCSLNETARTEDVASEVSERKLVFENAKQQNEIEARGRAEETKQSASSDLTIGTSKKSVNSVEEVTKGKTQSAIEKILGAESPDTVASKKMALTNQNLQHQTDTKQVSAEFWTNPYMDYRHKITQKQLIQPAPLVQFINKRTSPAPRRKLTMQRTPPQPPVKVVPEKKLKVVVENVAEKVEEKEENSKVVNREPIIHRINFSLTDQPSGMKFDGIQQSEFQESNAPESDDNVNMETAEKISEMEKTELCRPESDDNANMETAEKISEIEKTELCRKDEAMDEKTLSTNDQKIKDKVPEPQMEEESVIQSKNSSPKETGKFSVLKSSIQIDRKSFYTCSISIDPFPKPAPVTVSQDDLQVGNEVLYRSSEPATILGVFYEIKSTAGRCFVQKKELTTSKEKKVGKTLSKKLLKPVGVSKSSTRRQRATRSRRKKRR